MWNLFGNDWEYCIGACLCGWKEEVISFRTDKDYFCMEPVSIVPWDDKSIEDEPVWFQGLLHRMGDEETIRFLPFAYGTCVCPDCGKPMRRMRSKTGKIYYGCTGYPACKFLSWDAPTGTKCPKCGKYLVKRNGRIHCSEKSCDYTEELKENES